MQRRARLRIVVAALGVTAIAGCQAVLPSAVISNLTTAREDKKTIEQAKREAFPSPKDVGLGPVEAKK